MLKCQGQHRSLDAEKRKIERKRKRKEGWKKRTKKKML